MLLFWGLSQNLWNATIQAGVRTTHSYLDIATSRNAYHPEFQAGCIVLLPENYPQGWLRFLFKERVHEAQFFSFLGGAHYVMTLGFVLRVYAAQFKFFGRAQRHQKFVNSPFNVTKAMNSDTQEIIYKALCPHLRFVFCSLKLAFLQWTKYAVKFGISLKTTLTLRLKSRNLPWACSSMKENIFIQCIYCRKVNNQS